MFFQSFNEKVTSSTEIKKRHFAGTGAGIYIYGVLVMKRVRKKSVSWMKQRRIGEGEAELLVVLKALDYNNSPVMQNDDFTGRG